MARGVEVEGAAGGIEGEATMAGEGDTGTTDNGLLSRTNLLQYIYENRRQGQRERARARVREKQNERARERDRGQG